MWNRCFFSIAFCVLSGIAFGEDVVPTEESELATSKVGELKVEGVDLTDEACDSACCSRSGDCGGKGCCKKLFGHRLKGHKIGPCWTLDVGGSFRARYHWEDNIRPGAPGGLSGLDDDFCLTQVRLWTKLKMNSRFSIYGEFMDAQSIGETLPSRGREVNRHDLYQLHADVVLWDGDGKMTARVGRQEIRYGQGRLMMAPNWANRRRGHDGVRLMWESDDWSANYFWIRPIQRNAATFVTFDNTNMNQQLYGIYSTYKGFEYPKIDLYWLAFEFYNATGGNGSRFDTIGSRIYKEDGTWLYEVEGGLQLGRNPDDSAHTAGFVVAGIGRRAKCLPWTPELWVYYDWASGDNTTGNGFHHYLARAHYFMGFMDLYGRRNLEDINVRLTLKPTEKLTLLTWFHSFSLADGNDVPYNLNMRPYAGLAAGAAGSQHLGHELDILATYQWNEQTQLRLGISHFWSGSFYRTTPGVASNNDANFYYTQYSYKF